MIRLFRKIRHNLLSESNYSIYILYAVGEIVLVMVGILLALQIDNWNDKRKLESVSYGYLGNLKKDLIADTVSINDMLVWGDRWERRIGNYYEYYNEGQWSVHQIVDSCKNTGFAFTTYIPINSTFTDMLSSGNSSLLSDDLRMSLQVLKKKQDLMIIISEHLTQDIKINVHELEKYWILDDALYFKTTTIKSRRGVDLKAGSYVTNGDQKLMQGLVFHHNIFNWTYNYIELLRIYGTDIIKHSNETIALINRELN